jgi:DNA polymerase III alpha subunit
LLTVEFLNDSKFDYKIFTPNSPFDNLHGFVVEKEEIEDVFEDKAYIELGKKNFEMDEEKKDNYVTLDVGDSVNVSCVVTELDSKFFTKGDYNIHCIKHHCYHSTEENLLGPLGQKIKIKCRPMIFKIY